MIALFMAAGAGAQPTAPEQAEGAARAPASSLPVDEIRVRGTRSLAAVQDEAGRATEAFYRKLNTVLTEDDYQVNCTWEADAAALIRKRVCRSGWQEDLLTEVGRVAYDDRPFDPSAQYWEKQRIFQEKLLAAINSDPELIAAAKHLLSLQDEIAALNGSRSSSPLLPSTGP
jgi:hypothetical protein